MRTKDDSDLRGFFCTVLLCIIAGVLFYGCSAAEESAKYSGYVETSGITTDVNAVVVERLNGKFTVDEDKFSISYTYEVDGVTYTGALVNDVSVSAGTKIRVLYNPTSPEQSKGELLY